MPGPPTRVVDPVAPVADLPLGQQETRIHWTKFHRKIVVGTASTLEGQVVTEEGAIGGADVDLYARAATSQAWTHVASATTDSERGVFAFGCLEPVRTTLYRVVHEATPFHARSSGDKQVAVARRLPDSLERVRANRFSFRGTVLPRDAGLSVQLERRTCRTCAWRTVERTTTDRRARWGFRIDVSRLEGSRWYRATAPGDQRNARGHSDRVWRFTR
ncbi:MAG: hypothetical protein ACRDOM_05905 [Nocardioides sp.]